MRQSALPDSGNLATMASRHSYDRTTIRFDTQEWESTHLSDSYVPFIQCS